MVIRTIACALVIVLFAGFSMWATANAEQQANAAAAAREAGEPGPYVKDGTFTGTARSYGGPMEVSVTVENGYLTNIQILKTYDDSPYIDDVAAALVPQMQAQQTTELDVVTNASYSSHGLMACVHNALLQAGALPDEDATSYGTTSHAATKTTAALKKRAQEKAAESAEPTITWADVFAENKDENLSGFAAGGK